MNKYILITVALFLVWVPMASAQTYQVGTLTAGIINGVPFPARCGDTHAPTWCSGTTPDQWILAACAQIPAIGIVDLNGLTGNLAATTRGCTTPTRQIAFMVYGSNLTVTETDGDITFPLDNGSSIIGPGVGQCLVGGRIKLAASAIVTAIVGPAHEDGTQESFTVSGICVAGKVGATVTQALMYAHFNYANTTFQGNNAFQCNTYCLKVWNGSDIRIFNNWLDASEGVSGIVGQPLLVLGAGSGTGCNIGPVQVYDNQIEHAEGTNSAELTVSGDGAGALACGVNLSGNGIERDTGANPSTTGVRVSDCKSCTVDAMTVSGSGTGTDAVNVSQTGAGRTKSVTVTNINSLFGSYTNIFTDATPGAPPSLTAAANPTLDRYVVQPVANGQTLYSAATNPIYSCVATTLGQQQVVSDATTPTYMGAYASGGAVTTDVLCSYNGSSYGWVTH